LRNFRAKTNQLRLMRGCFLCHPSYWRHRREAFFYAQIQGFKGPSALNSFTAESKLRSNRSKNLEQCQSDFHKLAEVFFHPKWLRRCTAAHTVVAVFEN
jgi:hypothetical protein